MFGDDRHLPWSDSGLQYLPSLQDHEPKFMLEISSSRCHKKLSQGRSGVRWCWELRVDLLWSRWHCTINIDICQHAILQLQRWAYNMREDSSSKTIWEQILLLMAGKHTENIKSRWFIYSRYVWRGDVNARKTQEILKCHIQKTLNIYQDLTVNTPDISVCGASFYLPLLIQLMKWQ